MITLPANRRINLSEETVRGRYEKEPVLHFNPRLNGDGIPELRSEL
jgi:hypothetical protein